MKWQKGQSGNRHGRPRGIRNRTTIEIGEIARLHASEALVALVEICRRGQNESARIAAAKEILDRGYGRSKQSLTVDSAPHDPLAQILKEIGETSPRGFPVLNQVATPK